MSWVAVGVTTAAVVGGAVQANSANKASAEQGRASERALQSGERQFALTQADQKPWVDTGKAALSKLRGGLGLPQLGSDVEINPEDPRYKEIFQSIYDRANREHIQRYGVNVGVGSGEGEYANQIAQIHDEAKNAFAQKYGRQTTGEAGSGELLRRFTMDDFQNDPVTKASLQFGLSEGSKALSRMKRAQGTFNSGGTAKALTRYATDYVGQKAGASRDRFVQDQTNVFNRLSGVSGTGQTTAQNTGVLGANYANNAGNIVVGEGNARGAAAIAQGNAFSGALSQSANAVQRQTMFNQLMNRPQTSSLTTPQYVSDDYRWSLS